MSSFESSIYDGDHTKNINLATELINGAWRYKNSHVEMLFTIYISGMQRGIKDCVSLEHDDKGSTCASIYLDSIEYTNNLMDRFNRRVTPVDI